MRQLDGSLVGLLSAELDDALFDSSVDRIHRSRIVLRNEYGYGILLRTAVDGYRLPSVEMSS